MVLQDGAWCNLHGRQHPELLTWLGRRLSRKKAIATYERVYAYGGYPRGSPILYGGDGHGTTAVGPEATSLSSAASAGWPWAAVISIAGPQFEVSYLESIDFIIAPWDDDEGVDGAEPLFPHYYSPQQAITSTCASSSIAQSGASSTNAPSQPPTAHRKLTFAKAHALSPEAKAALGLVPIAGSEHVDPSRVAGLPARSKPAPAPPSSSPAGPTSASSASGVAHLHPGLRLPHMLYGSAYQRSIREDMTLVLTAFSEVVGKVNCRHTASASSSPSSGSLQRQRGYLQLPAVGLGFFANYLLQQSIANLLLPFFLAGLREAITQHPGGWPNIAIIEMCDFTSEGSFRLLDLESGSRSDAAAAASSFAPVPRVLHGHRRSLLHFEHPTLSTYICGVVNAGDCFCIPGNEHGYASVESMLGENTSMRRGQSYVHNPRLLDKQRFVAVKSPLMLR